MDSTRIRHYEVETITLNEVFSSEQMPDQIDFLSLDTEGSELDILAGLDLNESQTAGIFKSDTEVMGA